MTEYSTQFTKRQPEKAIVYLDGPWEGDLLKIMHGILKKRGWQTRLYRHSIKPRDKVAGVITRHRPDTPGFKELHDLGCPIVRFGSYPHPDDHNIPAVLPDYETAGHIAAVHFADRQYKHVITVGAAAKRPGERSKALLQSFEKKAVELELNCRYYSTYYEGIADDSKEYRRQRRKEDYQRLVKDLPKPCGLFASNDRMAILICEACFEAGIEMPGEIAVLGYGNDILCEMQDVPLSSVDPDLENRCALTVALLEQLMTGDSAVKSQTFSTPSGIVERASTDVLAASDPDVRKALNFIWDNIALDLSVEDVAAEVGLSRNTLQRRLKQDIGRGIAEEIRRRRLECVCDLLKRTDLTVEEIAPKTGFRYKSYLHRAFHKRFGKTPQAYRNDCRV